MLKFLLGVVVGVVLVVVVGVVLVLAVAGMRNRAPAIASNSTLVLHLDGSLPEREPVEVPLNLFGGRSPLTMREVWGLLRAAAKDSRIRAVVVEPQGLSVGWAKMQELREELQRFRQSGKPLYAYLKTPGSRDYYVASAASKVYMGPVDMLDLKGIRFELMYFKGTLDKLGVKVDVEHAGKYKDYGDMFTRTDMSPETTEVLNSIIDRVYADLVRAVGSGRNLSGDQVQDAINNGPLLSAQVEARKLVDGLCYEDEMFGKLHGEIKDDVRKVTERIYLRNVSEQGGGGGTRIAWVVAEGEILRGSPESSPTSDNIESEAFTKTLERVGNDSGVKGVVVRIDSPGGEVFATDSIWKSMNQLAKKKPMVISMSDAAASGGYYMAMAKAPIVAYPETLTGSIGVVFGKPDLRGLYDKIGVSKSMLKRGRFADIDSDYEPLDDAEKAKLREGIDAEYKTFVGRVSASRGKPEDQVQDLAQGRVWIGEQAKANGLVDELGGIDKAIEMVKRQARIPASDKVSLTVYPSRVSWLDVLFRSSEGDDVSSAADAMAGYERSANLIPMLLRRPDVQIWLHPGYLSVLPIRLAFH